jgi:hypothetical protein
MKKYRFRTAAAIISTGIPTVPFAAIKYCGTTAEWEGVLDIGLL